MKKYSIVLNLCDEYSVMEHDFLYVFERLKSSILTQIQEDKFDIKAVRIGSETCGHLYSFIKPEFLLEMAKFYRNLGLKVLLVFPVISESMFDKCKNILTYLVGANIIDYVVVNDYGMLKVVLDIKKKVIFGRLFDKRLRDPRVDSNEFLSCNAEGVGTISNVYIDLFEKIGINELELEALELGINEEIPKQIEKIYYHYPYRYITCGRICEFSGINKDNNNKFKIDQCEAQCMSIIAETSTRPIRTKIYKHCNSIVEAIALNNKILELFCHEKASIIYTPNYKRRFL